MKRGEEKKEEGGEAFVAGKVRRLRCIGAELEVSWGSTVYDGGLDGVLWR